MMYLYVMYILECVLASQQASVNPNLKPAESWYYSDIQAQKLHTEGWDSTEITNSVYY